MLLKFKCLRLSLPFFLLNPVKGPINSPFVRNQFEAQVQSGEREAGVEVDLEASDSVKSVFLPLMLKQRRPGVG